MFFPNTACLFLIYLPQWALGWPKGAPSGACSTLTPNHGASPQNTVSPYMIKAEPMGEGLVQLTVRGTSGAANPFRGFMIQVEKKNSCPHLI